MQGHLEDGQIKMLTRRIMEAVEVEDHLAGEKMMIYHLN